MIWTTTKPTQPGWYFQRWLGEVEVIYVERDIFTGDLYIAPENGEWSSEPIPEPTEREERETQP